MVSAGLVTLALLHTAGMRLMNQPGSGDNAHQTPMCSVHAVPDKLPL